jgi:hypothetical protein
MLINVYGNWINPDNIDSLSFVFSKDKVKKTKLEGIDVVIEGKTPDEVAECINKQLRPKA